MIRVCVSASPGTRIPADLVLDELEVAASERDPHDGARQLVEHLVHVPVAQSIRNARPALTEMYNNTGGYNRARVPYTTSRYPYTTLHYSVYCTDVAANEMAHRPPSRW